METSTHNTTTTTMNTNTSPNAGDLTPRKRSQEDAGIGLEAERGPHVLMATSVTTPTSNSNSNAHSHQDAEPVSSAPHSPTLSSVSSLTELTSTSASPGPKLTSQPASTSPSKSAASPRSSHVLGTVQEAKSQTGAPPIKKPKLTFLEKEAEKAARKREKEEREQRKAEEKAARQKEKEEKEKEDRKRAEEKTQKEEDKRTRQEEKRKQAEEKEVVKRAKEMEKAEKQKLKQEKENEKLKKEKAQLRIGSFFARPAGSVLTTSATLLATTVPASIADNELSNVSSRRSSVASETTAATDDNTKATDDNTKATDDNTKATSDTPNPEFEKWILPFHVADHTQVAPSNRWTPAKSIDVDFLQQDQRRQLEHANDRFGRPRRRFRRTVPVRSILERLRSEEQPTGEQSGLPLQQLRATSYKYLYFFQDVRPPYQGTYTRQVSPRSARKVSRNPFSRTLPCTNYDYDSEAEWEPPAEDDEDLNDDDEMSEADDNDEEMDDFLDDEDDQIRRKGPLSDMEPISSGLCWTGTTPPLEQYRMDVLHDSTTFPINPYSSTHWLDETRPKLKPMTSHTGTNATVIDLPTSSSASMLPPRAPLSAVAGNQVLNTPAAAPKSVLLFSGNSENTGGVLASKPRGRPPRLDKMMRMIEPEFLPAFREAVNGSDLTKTGLIEILKKQFPQCSKDAIKDTLTVVAVRVGKKEAEKKWHLVA